jgi:MFS family permease
VLVVSAAYQVAKFMIEPVLVLHLSPTEPVELANPIVRVPVVSRVILPYTVAVLGGMAALAIAALAPLVRYRRSGQVERQQLKWLVFVLAVGVVGGLAAAALINVVPVVANGLAVLVIIELALGIPLAVGAAILRYRLYDIDRLINRTLVYGLLTILLGGVYAGLVLTLGQLAGGIGADPPSWAVAGATLAVAALFQPARRRVQRLVDRRFNRRRYDAAKTVAAFSARLRDEIDLDTLAAELLAVVDQTTQPTQASLWLRPHKAPTQSD